MLPELGPSRQVVPIVDYLQIAGTRENVGTVRLWVGNPDARASARSDITHGGHRELQVACCPVWVKLVMIIAIILRRLPIRKAQRNTLNVVWFTKFSRIFKLLMPRVRHQGSLTALLPCLLNMTNYVWGSLPGIGKTYRSLPHTLVLRREWS